MNCGSQAFILLFVLRVIFRSSVGWTARELTWRNGKVHASDGGEPPVNGGPEIFFRRAGCVALVHQSRKQRTSFGLHGAAVECGADLQFALYRFIEIADCDCGHIKKNSTTLQAMTALLAMLATPGFVMR